MGVEELFDLEKRLGFGFLRLPSKSKDDPNDLDLPRVCQLVDAYLDAGYRYFDTAYNYLGYKSETFFKAAVTDRYPRERFVLTTKLPISEVKEDESPYRIFNHQLEKCGVDHFDIYLFHGIGRKEYETAKRRGFFDFLKELKATGKARYIGFSFHDTADVLDEILTEHPEVDVVQLQLNYLDWEHPLLQSNLCYEVCRKHGKPIMVMGPVKGGLLSKLPPEAERLMQEMDAIQSPSTWALRFVGSQPGVVMVLSGMSTIEQIRENTQVFSNFVPLTEAETQMLGECAKIIKAAVPIACTGCSYCTNGCPAQIPIPRYFSLYNENKIHDWQVNAHGRYREMTENHAKASDCIACGQCEEKCPQHLSVIDWLQTVAKEFEPR